jgi:CMP-N-acetylneuraminic acid synthetase
MGMKRNIVALVPMRHESVRVPGKNYRPFAGARPLYHHIVTTLQRCEGISRMVIDTDSEAIMVDARAHFPEVILLRRPEHLRDGAIAMNEVLLHDTAQVPAEFYLQTHSTNPLLTSETIERAIERFVAGYPEHDSLFSVTRIQARLWDAQGRAMNHDPDVLLRTQDLPAVYEENSCIYLFTRQTLVRRRNRIGERPMMFEIDRREAADIDEEIDFRLAEMMYLEQRREEKAA